MRNIILIMADQMAASAVGCYGSGVASTPNLDRLAARGVRFDRCYTTHPTCAPNRAAMLTGRNAFANGIVRNNLVLAGDTPTYASILRAHGYATGGFGKFHQTPHPLDPPTDLGYLGFDEVVVHEDTKWGPWLDWVQARAPEHLDAALALCGSTDYRLTLTDGWAERSRRAKREILDPLRDPVCRHTWVSPLPAELHDAVYVTDCALSFLGRKAAPGSSGERFLCKLSYVDPHNPYDPPKPYDEAFAPETMPDPLPAEWLEQGPAILDEINIRNHRLNLRDEAIPLVRSRFHGTVKLMDEQIGRVMSFLDENDLWSDTVVIFTTDHGDLLGDHGFLTKGGAHYDACVRVPLIVAGGGISSAVSDRLICTLDFLPTICALAGIAPNDVPPNEGVSFAEPLGGESAALEQPEVYISGGGICQSVVTDDGWRLSLFPDSLDAQMFNLAEDPGEQQNLFGREACGPKREELLLRFGRAATRGHMVPHYRNMPVWDGRKRSPGVPGAASGVFTIDTPLYGSPDPPPLLIWD